MGRLAGTSPKTQAAYAAWQKEREDYRRHIASMTPIVHPPAGRRQLALLWYVAARFSREMRIGWRGDPPLTDDMRALIRQGHLLLRRESRGEDTVRPPRSNYIVLTPSGEAVLARARISDADKHYIDMAMKTGVVR
jgi:hypothetical protein